MTFQEAFKTSQSALAVEYTDSTIRGGMESYLSVSPEEWDPTPTGVQDTSIDYLMVRLQSWSFRENK